MKVLALAVSLSLFACAEPRQPNVILVIADTLRADSLSLYGYERDTSTVLEGLAKNAVVFERAMSQSACTYPSMNSLLTSRYPARFSTKGATDLGIPANVPSLPVILKGNGYATAAVSASLIVRNTPSSINPKGGFGRGFDHFDETCANQSARCLNGRAAELIEGLREPFFLYLHYMDTHAPYLAPAKPAGSRGRYARGTSKNQSIQQGFPRPVNDHINKGKPARYQKRDIAFLRDRYDEEVHFFDQEFGRLAQMLTERGLLDHSVLVLAADHGEAFLEKTTFGHCNDGAYQSAVHTPLLLWLPGVSGGRRGAIVQNLDLVPTLLDYLQIDDTGLDFDGRNLAPVVDSDQAVNPFVFASQGTSRVVADSRFKLIYSVGSSSVELFDLEVDPDETTDLSLTREDIAGPMLTTLQDWLEEFEGDLDPLERVNRAQEVKDRLRELGYL
jgi:arylsulfatase